MLISFRRIFMIVLLVVLMATSAVHAQETPPAVVAFTSEVMSISLAEAEAGVTPTTMRWVVTALRQTDRIHLQQLTSSVWVNLNAPDEILPPIGASTINIVHSQTFAPPTYRLVIVDES